jgi:hypothetical protein
MRLERPADSLKFGLAIILVLALLRVGLTQDIPIRMTHAIVEMSGTNILPTRFRRNRRLSGALQIGTAESTKSQILNKVFTAEWLSMNPMPGLSIWPTTPPTSSRPWTDIQLQVTYFRI